MLANLAIAEHPDLAADRRRRRAAVDRRRWRRRVRARADALAALVVSMLTFLAEHSAVHRASTTPTAGMQFVERVPWIRLQRRYYLGVDGISMPLILLTTFITPLVVIAGWEVDQGTPGAVLGRVPDPRRPDDRRVLRRWTRCCSTCSGKRC